jgi:plastocyanin
MRVRKLRIEGVLSITVNTRFERRPGCRASLATATRIALAAAWNARQFTLGRWPALALCALLAAAPAVAAALEVAVRDATGAGLADVVVTLAPVRAPSVPIAAPPRAATAIMDQRELAFVPQVLVVGVGAVVDFPNHDDVSHQVYSFSRPKPFQLPLYKGRTHPPVSFDRPGLVVLGCNIHDEMVGYIYVTDAPHFGKTGPDGTLHLPAPADGDYRLTVWGPRIADPPESLTRTLHLVAGSAGAVEFRLARPLRARPEPRPRRPDWEY